MHIISREPCYKGFDEVTCETFDFLIEALQWFCLPENNDLIWHPLHADARPRTHARTHTLFVWNHCAAISKESREVTDFFFFFFRSVEW